ncbi:MAG: hypothetical protein V3571_09730 [Pseudodesulfovibrio sp.]
MRSTTDITPGRGWLPLVPLVAAYAVLPLWAAATRLWGALPVPPANSAWAALAGVGLLVALLRPVPGHAQRRGSGFRVALAGLLVGGMILHLPDWLDLLGPALPYLGEGAPVAYILFGTLWAATCGLPDRAGFQRFGALLGALCLLDLLAEAALFRAAPTVRLIGNADVLAGLLLLSLCAGLRPGGNQGGAFEPDQGRPVWRVLTLIGLMACLSRPGLFGAAWVVLCFGRGHVARRALVAALCLVVLGITFFLPATASDAIRFTDYWLWMEGVRLFTENPALLLTGFPVNEALPLNFPVGMSVIWEAAVGVPAIFGAFVGQVPSFWLRLSLAWGAAAPAALLCAVFALLLRRLTRFGAGLVSALFAQGMTTPLLYDPATGVCITLAFVLALTPVPETQPQPVGPADPVEEWDLR